MPRHTSSLGRQRQPSRPHPLAGLIEQRVIPNPVLWVSTILGEHLWSKQREIIESVRDNRRTAVHSCHSSGKSYLAARVVCWWIASHPLGQARVVTSAPTGKQVKAILWHEIGRAHAKGKLVGRLNQTEWWAMMPQGNEEMIAFGQKPADMDPTAFQGIHEKYVLVILDEGCGIPKTLYDAADTLLSNEHARILVIGNPDDPATEFGEVCKPGSGWNVIGISAFDTPNFTGEPIPDNIKPLLVSPTWVEEKKRKWGESNPLYIAKVLGKFPQTSTDGLIPVAWIKRAQEKYRQLQEIGQLDGGLPIELGVDVGGGGDKSVKALRRGQVVKVHSRDSNPDTMQTLGDVLKVIQDTNAISAKVDKIGIGTGLVNRAEEISRDQSKPKELRNRADTIIGVNVGERANDPDEYVNLRAEGYWELRDRFEEGTIAIDPDDEDLAAQLVDLKFKRGSGGRIQVESKEDIRRRGKPSPDDADAVMLSFLNVKKKTYAGTGRLFG